MSEPLVIVGNGMAAARLAEELATRTLGRYAVAVIGAEPQLAYNRVLLSSLLANEIGRSDIELKPARWWRDRGVTLRYGSPVAAVDTADRTVTTADQSTLSFAKLVFATGSHPIRPSLPGIDLPGVMTFRDIGDVDAMTRLASRGTKAVVIGGGLLGLEAAHGLRRAGAKVTLVHRMERLMERQLDDRAARLLKRAVEAQGAKVLLQAETIRIVGSARVEGIELSDGRSIAADMIVFAAGVRPNAELAAAAGIQVERGIVVDDRMHTNVAGVHAIGECAEHRGRCYGLVEPAYEQASVLARQLAGDVKATYAGSVLATNLKVSDVNVFSAGEFLGGNGTEEITLIDEGIGLYKKLVIANDRLVGAVLCGDTADGLWYLELIRSGQPIHRMRDDLVFGRALSERAAA